MVTLRLHHYPNWKHVFALAVAFFAMTACSEQRSDRMFQGNYGAGFSPSSDSAFSASPGSGSIMEH